MTGFVSLVGAGPGDLELLTVKAVKRLAAADLVLHDALIDPKARSLAPQARWFYVGKRAGRESISQETIERLLVRAARRGERVVRLKCGDPFVFGRGGEEALTLAREGVPFEVIPGVSSAIAAPASSGIPVTHRGRAAAFCVVSGHAESAYAPLLDSLAPGAATVVVLMGLGRADPIAGRLIARGWSGATPAAVVLDGTRDAAFTWRGPLDQLGTFQAPESHASSPGVIVVGDVVAVADELAASARFAGRTAAVSR
jgi:uroporphyrin-III C-methyltransferase/precorrin-2 dehydrogenase/sirohydrochlorin ferrochelatase